MGIAEALDHEWARTSRTPRAGRALRRWAMEWPSLRDCRDLCDLLEQRRDACRAQGLLYPLAKLAPVDELAARTLLQALLPGLITMARGPLAAEPAALDELVGLAWERIRTYPPTREGGVAGNVLLDVRKRFNRSHSSADRVAAYESWDEPSSDDRPNLDRADVVGLLREGRNRGLIDGVDLDVIVRTRMFEVSMAEVAASHGVEPAVLGRSRWRAEEALRRMARADRYQVMPWSAA